MENDKNIRIRKVHLLSMLQLLGELYDKGVNFVDVSGVIIDGQDTVGITFNKTYMLEGYEDNYDEFVKDQFPSTIKVKLSDNDFEDLNKLI